LLDLLSSQADLSLDTVQVFSTGDLHRQLLFTLVVDSISFNLGRPNEQVIETSSHYAGDRADHRAVFVFGVIDQKIGLMDS
jgi:hypothetical protein